MSTEKEFKTGDMENLRKNYNFYIVNLDFISYSFVMLILVYQYIF